MRRNDMAGAALRDERMVAPNDHFRLNPAERRISYSTELRGSAFVGQTHVEMGDDISLAGTLRCGLSTRIASDPASFRGIAAVLSISDQDEVIAELVLLNRDPSLNIPVARSDEMEDLAADWQMWARRFNVPLILIEPDGAEQMVSNRVGGVDVGTPKPRRPHALFAARRPRFLTRRKVGQIDRDHRVQGREIIARA